MKTVGTLLFFLALFVLFGRWPRTAGSLSRNDNFPCGFLLLMAASALAALLGHNTVAWWLLPPAFAALMVYVQFTMWNGD